MCHIAISSGLGFMTCVLFFQNLQWIEFKGSNDDLMIDEKINKSMGSPTELITKILSVIKCYG